MITVLGASGFIGRHLTAELERRGVDHHSPGRHESPGGGPLGHVVYCAGVTGDFRRRPLDAAPARPPSRTSSRVSNGELTGALAALTGCSVTVAGGAPTQLAPEIVRS